MFTGCFNGSNQNPFYNQEDSARPAEYAYYNDEVQYLNTSCEDATQIRSLNVSYDHVQYLNASYENALQSQCLNAFYEEAPQNVVYEINDNEDGRNSEDQRLSEEYFQFLSGLLADNLSGLQRISNLKIGSV